VELIEDDKASAFNPLVYVCPYSSNNIFQAIHAADCGNTERENSKMGRLCFLFSISFHEMCTTSRFPQSAVRGGNDSFIRFKGCYSVLNDSFQPI
jgi:hypothetical protein